MNRVSQAITKQQANIEQRLRDGKVTNEALHALHKVLDLDLGEFVRFQEVKSLAVAHELLTLEEGMTVYELLGTVPAVFNGQSVATKAVLTGLLQELLTWMIRMKQRASA